MLTHLELANWRNIRELSLTPAPGTNVISGQNAQGKTNLIEAIYCLSRGSSFRARDTELVGHGEEFYRVKGSIKRPSLRQNLTVTYEKVTGTKVMKLNETKVARHKLIEALPTVLFTPDDVNLILGEPVKRRTYFDELLSATSASYRDAIKNYRTILEQRGRLLWKVREGYAKLVELEAWDNALARDGATIISQRYELVVTLNRSISKYYDLYNQDRSKLELTYLSFIGEGTSVADYYKELLANQNIDIKEASTTKGPHRDDFVFKLEGQPMATQASRGEIRTAVLALKLVELDLLEERLMVRPTLLLDDIYSELDDQRQQQLSDLLKKQQTFITTTLPERQLKGTSYDKFMVVVNGKVEEK